VEWTILSLIREMSFISEITSRTYRKLISFNKEELNMSNTAEYTIRALDSMSWVLILNGKTDKKLFTRKYLLEVLFKQVEIDSMRVDELKVIEKEYLSKLEQFSELHVSKIKIESSGELSLSFDSNNTWHHRSKLVIIQSMFEFILKKICVKKDINYKQALEIVLEF